MRAVICNYLAVSYDLGVLHERAVDVEADQADVYYFAPQKNLASDGGIWFALFSAAAIERVERIAASGRYIPEFLSLKNAIDNSRLNQTLNTPALSTLLLMENQLDWINGNKSCLGNAKLSGMFLGLNMNTRAEHIFRAVVEATAFGARMIVEAYKTAGVAVKEIRACGGIAMKNAMLMQIYADVLGVPIRVSACQQGPALGAAIYAAVGAGIYPDNYKAVEAMADTRFTLYTPDPDHQAAYETLYQEYKELHDYFGRGGNRIMERLYDRRMG